MTLADVAEKLGKKEKSKRNEDIVKFAKKVQEEVIEPLCKEFDIAFLVHPSYDEFTFISKEGVWYRPEWGGATSTMKNVKDPKMKKALDACYKLIGSHGLIGERKNYIKSFENGISKKLKDKIMDRLSYMACCP